MAANDKDEAASGGSAEESTATTEPAGETTAVTQAAGAAAVEPPAPTKTRRPSRVRKFLIGFLIFLAILGVVVSGVTIWTHYTIFNTQGYMNIVGPIGKDPTAIKSLSDYVAGEVVSATDLQTRVADALPEKIKFFAGPITSAVNDFIAKGTYKVLSTPQAYELWLKVNEFAHEKVVALLRGETNAVYIQGSDIKLNLIPLISQVLVWLDGKLPGGLSDRFSPPVIEVGTSPEQSIQQVEQWSGKTLPPDFGQITLITSDALGPAQTAVKWFDRLVWIIPLLTIALAAVSIWLSRRRGRTAIALGIGTVVAIIVTRVIIKRASAALVGGLKQDSASHVLKGVVDAALGPLTTITIWIVVIGAVAAIVAWILGRRDLRVAAVSIGKRAVGKGSDFRIPDSPVTSWVARHVLGVRWAVLIVGLLLLVLLTLSWAWFIIIVVLVLLFEAVLSLIAGQWPFHDREQAGDAAE